MPIALSNHSFNVSLAVDAALPEDQRPTFTFRHLTAAEIVKLMEVTDAAAVDTNYQQASASLEKELAPLLRGWRNVRDAAGRDVPFAGTLRGLCSVEELDELARGVVRETQRSELALRRQREAATAAAQASTGGAGTGQVAPAGSVATTAPAAALPPAGLPQA